MTLRRELGFWAVAAALLIGGLLRASPMIQPPGEAPSRLTDPRPLRGPAADVIAGDHARRIGQRDPFRSDRSAAAAPVAEQQTAIHTNERPVLRLRGLLGPPWQGVIEGLEGPSQVTLVRLGERYRDMHVRRIDARGVELVGSDTTWRLSLDSLR